MRRRFRPCAVAAGEVPNLIDELPALAVAGGRSGTVRVPWFVPGFAVAVAIAWVLPMPGWLSTWSRLMSANARRILPQSPSKR